jgi:peptidoglycan/LPS O-acetylase OafA/YrhL
MLIELDKRDTAVLKGLAISAIVFHNYFHLVSPALQNEFYFHPMGFRVFLETVVHPSLSIQALFSFFGHFGVQVFIFLSAYGLAKSHWEDPSDWATFMWSRIKKLYPMFGFVVLCWVILASMEIGPLLVIKRFGVGLICMFAGVSNLLPGHDFPPVGPWWFIPFIIQFYAIWHLLRRLTIKFGWPGLLVLVALSLIATQIANPVIERQWGVNLFETPIARMPSICLGIAAAKFRLRINAYVAVSAFAVLLLGSQYEAIWPLSFIAALIVTLYGYLKMRDTLKGSRSLELLGYYSLPIFLWNGIVRVPFVAIAGSPLSQLVFGLTSAGLSFIVAVLVQDLLGSMNRLAPLLFSRTRVLAQSIVR